MTVKRGTTMVIGSLVGTSLLLVGVSVMSAAHHERPNRNTRSQIQRQVSDLEKDESNFASDMNQLRRDLRYHASAVTVAKDRNFVRQDLLSIVLDRWQPAEESQDLERDQDLPSMIGESFADPAQRLMHNLEPESRS